MHHLRKQISRCDLSVAITQEDARGLFVQLLMNSVPQGRREDHRRAAYA